jgi:hypothetical protein
LAPRRGPLGPSPDRERAIGNAPAPAPGPLARLQDLRRLTGVSPAGRARHDRGPALEHLPARAGLCPTATSQYRSTTSYQFSDHIRSSLCSTAQPLYTSFPIISGSCFSEVTIGFIPRCAWDGCGYSTPYMANIRRHIRGRLRRGPSATLPLPLSFIRRTLCIKTSGSDE